MKNDLSSIMRDLERRGIVVSSEKRFAETIERGRALSSIKTGKLYRPEYRSFSSCVEHEFGCTSQQARNLITASKVYDELSESGCSVLPTNAKQCLEIANKSKKTGNCYCSVWNNMM